MRTPSATGKKKPPFGLNELHLLVSGKQCFCCVDKSCVMLYWYALIQYQVNQIGSLSVNRASFWLWHTENFSQSKH